MSKERHLDSNFQAVAVIENLIEPLIATGTSVKCVKSEGDCRYVNDAVLLLNQLDIEHPIGQYIVSVCNGFMKQYRTGGDTLLFFICQWMRAASLLCDMGLPLRTIITLLREVVDESISHAETHKVDIKTLTSEPVNKMCANVNDVETVGGSLSQVLDSGTNKNYITSSKTEIVNELKSEDESFNETNFTKVKSSDTISMKYVNSNNVIEMKDCPQRETEELADDEFIEIPFKQIPAVIDECIRAREEHLQMGGCSGSKDCQPQCQVSTTLKPNLTSNFVEMDEGYVLKRHCANQLVNEVTVADSHIKESNRKETDYNNSIPVTDTDMVTIKNGECSDEDDDFSWCFTPSKPCETTLNLLEDKDTHTTEMIDQSVPIITLNMTNIKDEEINHDEDDISWFFEAENSKSCEPKAVKASSHPVTASTENQDHRYNEELAQNHTKGLEDALIVSKASHITTTDSSNSYLDEVTNNTDSDLIRDINDLKQDIETDLETLKNRSNRNGFVRKTEQIPEKQPKETSLVDDEFNDTWNVIDSYNIDREEEPVECHDYPDDTSDFITVQLTFDKGLIESDRTSLTGKSFPDNGENLIDIKPSAPENIKLEHNKTKQLKETTETEEHKQSKEKTITEDLKMFVNLLKSLNIETTTKTLSEKVLDNSRHFRTFESVCNQSKESFTECDKNIKISNSLECLDASHTNSSMIDYHPNNAVTTLGDKWVDTSDVFSECNVKDELDLQRTEGFTRGSLSSPIYNSSQVDRKPYEKDSALVQAKHSKTDEVASLSDMNKLLNRLTTHRLQSTHPCRVTNNDISDNENMNLTSSCFKGNNVSKGHRISSAVSLRSRHLNTADGGDNIGLVKDRTNCEMGANHVSSENKNQTEIIVYGKTFKDDRAVRQTDFDRMYGLENVPHSGKIEEELLKHQSDKLMSVHKGLTSNTSSQPTPLNRREKEPNMCGIRGIVDGLLTRADEEIVQVICDIVSRVESQESLSMLDTLVDCCPVSGSKRTPRLVQGLVMKASLDCVTALPKLQGNPCRVLLVNGDLTATFRHKGYKSSTVSKSYTVNSFQNSLSTKDTWTQRITDVLKRLQVDVILCRGRISEEMISICDDLNIVAIEDVSYRQLKLLSDITETDMATYTQLATKDNICTGVKLHHLNSDVNDRNVFNTDQMCEVVITPECNIPQTVVFAEMTPVLVDLKEQEFWECLHQVTSCLQTGFLLPGNAQTEAYCMEYLGKKKEMFLEKYSRSKQPNKHCLPIVYETIEQSFHKYVTTFRHSGTKLDCVYDDNISKCAAWKTACNTVCTILNLEYYIITGITTESETRKSHLIL